MNARDAFGRVWGRVAGIKIGRVPLVAILALAGVLLIPAIALAQPTDQDDFETTYPSSTSTTLAGCQLCHGSTNKLFNPYGKAYFDSAYDFAAIESANSDVDPTGSTNIQEINAGTQPGWTSGPNNTIYNTDGTLNATNQNPPAGIGTLDPVLAPPVPVWDPVPASRTANRPRTCNTPASCTDSGKSWLNAAPSVAASNNGVTHYVHAVWTTDAPTGDESNGQVLKTTACSSANNPATGVPPYCSGVYYTRSTDGGATWSGGAAAVAPFAVSPTNVHAGRAAIATSGAYVYVAYVTTVGYDDQMCATDARVLYVRVNNNYGAAASWSAPVRLTSLSGRVDFPVISASGASVYVVHTDSANGQVILDRSTNNGTSFTQQQIGHTSATFDNGRSPGAPTCSSPPTPSGLEGFAGRATVAGDGTTAGAAWIQNNAGRAVVKISTDNGATWPGGANGSPCSAGVGACTQHLTPSGTLGAGGRSTLSATAASGRLGFAWVDDVGAAAPKGLYARIYQASTGWGQKKLVSCFQTTSPCVGAPAPAVYNDGYSPSVAFYGTAGVGITWSGCPYTPTTPATPCNGSSSAPVDPGAEILYKESWDNGATWSAGEGSATSYKKVVGNDVADSVINERPSVVFDTVSGASAGCAQSGSTPEAGCKRYLLFSGHNYTNSVYRVYMSIGTQT